MKRVLVGLMLSALTVAFAPILAQGGEPAESESATGVDAIVNGGFESGLKPWVYVANVVVVAPGAHSGLKSLQFSNDGRASITYQLVDVPATRPVLKFWLKMGPAYDAADNFVVSLQTALGAHVATLTSIPGNWRYRDWQPIVVDMAPYAGRKSLRLRFETRMSPFNPTKFSLDDVQLLGEAAATCAVAEPHAWPSAVAIYDATTGAFLQNGVLLKSDWVLTSYAPDSPIAGYDLNNLRIEVGASQRGEGSSFEIAELVVHANSGYACTAGPAFSSNVADIRLAGSVQESPSVKYATLPPEGYPLSTTTGYTAFGWLDNNTAITQASLTLQETQCTHYFNSNCRTEALAEGAGVIDSTGKLVGIVQHKHVRSGGTELEVVRITEGDLMRFITWPWSNQL